ncbi:monocarboxylate transporter 13-like [Portunus trituberculatus]|uniref:monocarboxylate transporter 13-like n=1 Tax=Portunus trituberculatus TaxID=210409 RepID=UPI001E1CCE08|nr:monocarboxylate transporter 13-like [Portunus trituberculatus]XP_045123348.1 monocarboxylate transporter 13-like [Portunus trituberculatus]XP_045123349.1 monocarboxylate transporter 13-like [Portunus trituberculatus]
MAPQNTSLEAGDEGVVGGVLAEVSLGSDITSTTPPFPAPLLPTPTLTNMRHPTPSKEDFNTALIVANGGGRGPACRCGARSPDVDGGWAWVVLGAAFLQFFITSALYYSFSVFFVELVAAFQQSRSLTGWVYATNSAVFMCSGPLGGWFLSRCGTRATLNVGAVLAAVGYLGSALSPSLIYIFFFYGVVNGVGTSFTFSGWVVGLARFWERRHALAMGVAMAGSGCGVLLLGPQIQVIVVHFGWRGAMILCAGLYLQLCVLATLYSVPRAPSPCRVLFHCGEEKSESQEEVKRAGETKTRISTDAELKAQHNTKKVLWSSGFCLLAASCFLTVMAITTVFAVLRDWAELEGLGAAFSSALAGSGGGDLLGRVLAGLLVGQGCSPLLLLGVVQLLLAVTIGFAAAASISTQLIAAMVGFGVACGLHSVISALMPSHFTSGEGVGHVLGCLLFVTGIGALVGPPVTGAIVDLCHSYGSAMVLCITAPALASILNLAAYFCHRRQHTQTRPGVTKQIVARSNV